METWETIERLENTTWQYLENAPSKYITDF